MNGDSWLNRTGSWRFCVTLCRLRCCCCSLTVSGSSSSSSRRSSRCQRRIWRRSGTLRTSPSLRLSFSTANVIESWPKWWALESVYFNKNICKTFFHLYLVVCFIFHNQINQFFIIHINWKEDDIFQVSFAVKQTCKLGSNSVIRNLLQCVGSWLTRALDWVFFMNIWYRKLHIMKNKLVSGAVELYYVGVPRPNKFSPLKYLIIKQPAIFLSNYLK